MKSLKCHIQENLKFKINRNKDAYAYYPKTCEELRQIIEDRYKELGPGTAEEPIDFNDIDVSKMTTFFEGRGLFENTKFEYIDISDWDVSHVEDMDGMFLNCKYLKSIGDLSNWDVSKVKNLSAMFNECAQLKSIDLSHWDISNVENIGYMFLNCEKLKSIGDLSNWDVSNVNIMEFMFFGCEKLESIGNISNWKVSNIKNMTWMFSHCKHLKTVGDLSKWDISGVADTWHMFEKSGIKNIPDWYEG